MDVDFANLDKSEFWKEKIDRAVQVRDANKSGTLSRADFMLILDRYKQQKNSTSQRLEKLTKTLSSFCDALGLKHESVQLSYSQSREKFLAIVKNWAEKGLAKQYFGSMFSCLDVNGEGYISLDKWIMHYKAYGIDPAYAPATFDAIDTNNDGQISEEEFVAYHMEYFYSDGNKLNSAILYGPMK